MSGPTSEGIRSVASRPGLAPGRRAGSLAWTRTGWAGRCLAWFRLFFGAYWIQAAAWKSPPHFGRADGTGLWRWIQLEIEHPYWAAYGRFVETVVVPHFTAVGWLVLAAELSIGVALLTGWGVRVAAPAGMILVANIAVGVLGIPGEGLAFYLALQAAFLLVLATHGGARQP